MWEECEKEYEERNLYILVLFWGPGDKNET